MPIWEGPSLGRFRKHFSSFPRPNRVATVRTGTDRMMRRKQVVRIRLKNMVDPPLSHSRGLRGLSPADLSRFRIS